MPRSLASRAQSSTRERLWQWRKLSLLRPVSPPRQTCKNQCVETVAATARLIDVRGNEEPSARTAASTRPVEPDAQAGRSSRRRVDARSSASSAAARNSFAAGPRSSVRRRSEKFGLGFNIGGICSGLLIIVRALGGRKKNFTRQLPSLAEICWKRRRMRCRRLRTSTTDPR